jgi:thioredoxin reductase (NADPH)
VAIAPEIAPRQTGASGGPDGGPDGGTLAAGTPAVIVGAGPAGVSTALWLHRLQVPLRLLERGRTVGGEAQRINLPIDDYPGLQVPDGRAMAVRLADHLSAAGIRPELGSEVLAVDLAGRRLHTSAGEVRFSALVVATGLRRRRLALADEDAYIGRGISYSATSDLAAIAGHDAIVVGGGDGAFENAAILAEVCPRVTVVHRGATPRARPGMIDRCRSAANVTILPGRRAIAIEVDGRHVTGLRVAAASGEHVVPVADQQGAPASGEHPVPVANQLDVPASSEEVVPASGEHVIPAGWIVVKIGFVPQTGFLRGQLALEPEGHVRVDRGMRTSVPGVFGAGDVANARAPSIAAAVGDGAIAARGVLEYVRSLERL